MSATKSGTGAKQETQTNQFPWIVSLQRNVNGQNIHVCSASLIHPMLVLTSAHCLYSSGGTFSPPQLALIGATSLDGSSNAKEKFSISDAYWSPAFNFPLWQESRATAEHDIAVLRISGASTISPVLLANYDPSPKTSILVPKWGPIGLASGTASAGTVPSTLLTTSMTVGVPGQSPCPSLNFGNICSIGKPMLNSQLSSACLSSDGAPLLIPGSNLLVGIIAYGPDPDACALSPYQISTSVAYHAQSFIKPLMAKLIDVGTPTFFVPSLENPSTPTIPSVGGPGAAINPNEYGSKDPSCSSFQAKVLKKRRYKRGTPVQKPFQATSQGVCATACMRNKPCMSFNYQSTTKTCILLTESWNKLSTVKDATFNAGYLACTATAAGK